MTDDTMQLVLQTLQNIQDEQGDFRSEVREAFAKMNGRVRRTETSLERWKTAIAVMGGVGTVMGFIIANSDKLQVWLHLLLN